jgi:hypothetical protein
VLLEQFRMSMKSDKGDGKPHHISIPPKDAIAIVPPKKVRIYRRFSQGAARKEPY